MSTIPTVNDCCVHVPLCTREQVQAAFDTAHEEAIRRQRRNAAALACACNNCGSDTCCAQLADTA